MVTAEKRQIHRRQRRKSIVDAAREVFQRNGVSATTMDAVARSAGVSKGGLYLHFSSKDELCMALASEMLDDVAEAFANIRRDGFSTGLQEFGALLTAYTELVVQHPTTIRNSLMWLASDNAADTTTDEFLAYRARVQTILAAFVAALQRGQSEGVIRDDHSPSTLAMQVWSSVLGAMLVSINAKELQRRFPTTLDETAIVPGVVEFAIRGVAAQRDQVH